MTEISEERLKRFWEWCGFKGRYIQHCPREQAGKHLGTRTFAGYEYPNGEHRIKLPGLTLNSLFKWAVPKLLEEIGRERLVALVNNALCDSIEAKGDVKDYLFLAIEKLIPVKEEKCQKNQSK